MTTVGHRREEDPPRPSRTSLVGRLDTLTIEGRSHADRAVLIPRGELVQGSTDTVARTLDALPDSTGRVDLDMAGVVFMDTAGLQVLDLLDAYGRLRRIPVTATRWSGQPRRVLELTGLDTTDPLRTQAHRLSEAAMATAPVPSPVSRERAEELSLLRAEVEQLRRAITTRPVIDQARGVLMATHSCTSEQAWEILREASQRSNTKLHTLAAVVTAGVETDGPTPPPELRQALRTAVEHCLR
ncbi:ANTAR domain-containing protein [Streptomyces sp. NPDC087425]|uniref:ANTAR domain-containing protein n=1 Tax=unclassified Streptomyces TaxID=2593676 RepID=UPI0038173D42